MDLNASEDLDRILDYGYNHDGLPLSTEILREKIFSDKSIEYIDSLFDRLNWYSPSILSPRSGASKDVFWLNEKGRELFANGGFKKIWEEKEFERVRLEEEFKVHVNSNENYNKTKRLNIALSIVTIIGTVITLIATFKTMNESEKPEKPNLKADSIIKSMDERIQKLEKRHEKLDSVILQYKKKDAVNTKTK